MQIHTVLKGESLYNIARKYGVPATKILSDNDLVGDRLTVGDELLILLPTRTVTTRGSDTLEGLSKRFDVKVGDILRENPALAGKTKIRPGQILTIKQESHHIGVGSAFSFIRKGCRRENITRTLPFATYTAIEGANITNSGVSLSFDISKNADYLNSEKKVTLLSVNDKTNAEFLCNEERYEKVIDEAIAIAKSSHLMGISISAKEASEKYPDAFCEFLLLFRKKLIGCDMILSTEIFENTPTDAAELSDAAILHLKSSGIKNAVSALENFASRAESSKVFVSLPSECAMGEGHISVNEIKELCYRTANALTTDKDSLLSGFEYTRYKTGLGEKWKLTFPSLEYTKAKLEALAELGYLGISFDADTVPIQNLLMFSHLFARADYSLP